jgi:hypothetical protein
MDMGGTPVLGDEKKFRKSKTYWTLTVQVSGAWHCVVGQVLRSISKYDGAFIFDDQASQE